MTTDTRIAAITTPDRAVVPSWQVVRRGSADVLVNADDTPPMTRSGDRFHHLIDEVCARLGSAAASHVAFEYADEAYTFHELVTLAAQVAGHLAALGVRRGDRLAVLMDRSILSPASVLAVSMLDATYVPLDASFPAERVAFIVEDSGASWALTLSRLAGRFEGAAVTVIALDADREVITARAAVPPVLDGDGEADPLCYVIYTSGSTGRPKGVGIRHSSICNFVRVAASQYGYRPDDRVYQGMTIAFDYSVEELWVPLYSGATLVPAPPDATLVGDDLHHFLRSRGVTAMCTVPTLLATLNPDLPDVRWLMVSGEACPRPVIEPWLTPGRRVLNAYGPTEITVTATWSVMTPGREVTIGGPLPTYSVVVLDTETGRPLPAGEIGEIAVAGAGVSDGYLNRPEQTASAFVDDTIGMPHNPTGRVYRTGDLGRITASCEIEYLGRIDTQVKLRGYRIELAEIETIASGVDGVARCVVGTTVGPFGTELVAYLVPVDGVAVVDPAAVDATLRTALPSYMMPTYYEHLTAVPMLASTKLDRAALPAPQGRRWVSANAEYTAPATPTEELLADLLAELLGLDKVSATADFFDDLGANSLTLAGFATRIRGRLSVRKVSMKVLYQHPSIERLATALDALIAPTEHIESPAVTAIDPSPSATPLVGVASTGEIAAVVPPVHRAGRRALVGTALAQVAAYAAVLFVSTMAALPALAWLDRAGGPIDLLIRSIVAGVVLFVGAGLGLVGVKWVAVGRFDTQPVPLWTARYVRFWIAKTAIVANPFNLFVGTPLYNVFLRLLGARIGSGAVLLCRPPVCCDLIAVGAGAVVRADVAMPGYRAHRGVIRTGRISIGDGALVCDASVLDIDTAIGDGAVLGTASSVIEGQWVPSHTTYQGSPAAPSSSRFDDVPALPVSRRRSMRYGLGQLIGLVLVTAPAAILAPHLATSIAASAGFTGPAPGVAGGTRSALGAVTGVLAAGAVVYAVGLIVSAALTIAVPRLLHRFVVADVVHPIHGSQYALARAIHRFSNNVVLNTIFGDSAMIVRYLRAVGYDLSRSTQTGSNFGVDQRHDNPFLCSFDRNTLVSDGLRLMNTEVGATSFRMRSIAVPPDTYLGNVVHYPADARVGANCLIATKAAVPIDGPVRTGVGLLGSPAFEIPRSVARDHTFDHYRVPGVLEQRLRRKLHSNVVTMVLYLTRSWMLTTIGVAALTVATASSAGTSALVEAAAITAALLGALVASTLLSILCERCVTRFRRLEPTYCSLYDEAFWAHERFWKLNYNAMLRVFDGTPIKPIFLRLQGARVGARLFDDGAGLTEPSMVTIGDDCMLNHGAALQCHSLEDGTFKSDLIAVGDRCTLSTNAFAHYATTIADDGVLEADAFLMKGSRIEAGTRWWGNPAREIESPRHHLTAAAPAAAGDPLPGEAP